MQGVIFHNDNSKTTFVTVNLSIEQLATAMAINSKTTFVTVNLLLQI